MLQAAQLSTERAHCLVWNRGQTTHNMKWRVTTCNMKGVQTAKCNFEMPKVNKLIYWLNSHTSLLQTTSKTTAKMGKKGERLPILPPLSVYTVHMSSSSSTVSQLKSTTWCVVTATWHDLLWEAFPVHVALMPLYQRLVTLSLWAIKSTHPSANFVVFFFSVTLSPVTPLLNSGWHGIHTSMSPDKDLKTANIFQQIIKTFNVLRRNCFFFLIKVRNDNLFLSDTLRCWESSVYLWNVTVECNGTRRRTCPNTNEFGLF